jgi:hypothetical protein
MPNQYVSGIQKRTVCINHTRYPVTVIDRNNLRCKVECTPEQYNREFILRDEYTVPVTAFPDLLRLFLERSEEVDYADFRIFKDSFYRQYEEHRFTPIQIILDCVIKEERLEEHQSLYIVNRDTVVSLLYASQAPDHPHSYSVLLHERYMELAKTVYGMTLSIELIDNEQLIGERYIYLAKQLLKLKPRKDPLRTSAVYVGITDRDDHNKPIVNVGRFELEEAEEKLGLYKTREEAISGGDVKTLRQEQVAEMNHQLYMAQLELKQLEQTFKEELERTRAEHQQRDSAIKEKEAQFAKEKLEMETEAIRLKARLDAERMTRESYYEERSYNRKDNHDWFKFITGVLVAGLGVAAVVMKK